MLPPRGGFRISNRKLRRGSDGKRKQLPLKPAIWASSLPEIIMHFEKANFVTTRRQPHYAMSFNYLPSPCQVFFLLVARLPLFFFADFNYIVASCSFIILAESQGTARKKKKEEGERQQEIKTQRKPFVLCNQEVV